MEILVVSDLHGMVPENLESLSQTLKGPVVFLGDVVGTTLLDQLQKLFYNGVYNHLKKLLNVNSNPKLGELYCFPTEKGQTLHDGFMALVGFLNQIGKLNVDSFSDYVLGLSRYVHFGHFVSNLPEEIRQALQKDMEVNAQKIIGLMTNFTNRGQDVFVIEGNWDARTPLDFYPTDECKPLPVNERSFYFKDYLLKNNSKVCYFNTVGTFNLDQHVFVFWPFDSSVVHTQVPEIYKADLDKNGGKLILFSHGQADWYSVKGDIPMTSEGSKIQEVMAIVINDLKPDIIVHGHLHENKPDYFYNGIPVTYCPLLSVRTLTI